MNVISFSVWGSNIYQYGVLENCCLAEKLFPNFKCWIFHNNDLLPHIKDALLKLNNVKLIAMPNENRPRNLLWRVIPSFNKHVNIFISRDADSRITEREVETVNEWLNSDKDFHIMRDHRMHRRKILAGMWGCRNQIMVPFLNKYIEYIKTDKGWGMDELFLRDHIYKHIVDRSFIHSHGRNRYEKHAVGFLRKCKKGEQFVGCVSRKLRLIYIKFPHLPKNVRLIKQKGK